MIPDGYKITQLILKYIDNTQFKSFHEKNMKKDTMNDSVLQSVCNYPIYPAVSKIYTEK